MRRIVYFFVIVVTLSVTSLVFDTQPTYAAWKSFGGSVCDPQDPECVDEIWFVNDTPGEFEVCEDGIRIQFATNFPREDTTDGGLFVDQGFGNDILGNDGIHLQPLAQPIQVDDNTLLSFADVRMPWEVAPNLAEDAFVLVLGGSGGGDGGGIFGDQPIADCSISDTVPITTGPSNLGADGRAFFEETFINFRFEHKGWENATQTPAEWYRVYVLRDGAYFADNWYQVRNNGGDDLCVGVVCSIPYDGPVLPNGEYQFWVQAYVSGQNQPWSATQGWFRVNVAQPPPIEISAVNPRQGRPELIWDNTADFHVRWYQLYIGKPGEYTGFFEWFPADDVFCEDTFGGDCFFYPEADLLEPGTYDVWMRAWNSGGYSSEDGSDTADAWAQGPDLVLPSELPDLPTTIGANIIDANSVSVQWAASARATWYEVFLEDDDGYLASGWQLGYDLGCGDGGVCETIPLSGSFTTDETYLIYIRAWGPSGFSTGGPFDPPLDGYAESSFTFGP